METPAPSSTAESVVAILKHRDAIPTAVELCDSRVLLKDKGRMTKDSLI